MLRSCVILSLLLSMLSCQAAYRLTQADIARVQLNKQDFLLELGDSPAYRLADIYENHQGAVLIFWQSQCPCVKRYENRIEHLFKRYSEKGLAFMYVSSNTNETFAQAKSAYEKRKSSLPLVRDEGGRLAKALHIKGTPTAVLIDKSGKIKYIGWIDNEHNEKESGRVAYLENAIKEYLEGKSVSAPTSPMFGCPIR